MASMKDKIAAFKNLFGNNGDAADQFIAAVTEKEKEVEAGGVAYKAAGEPDMAADAAGGDPAAEAAAEGEPVEEETNEMTLVADLTAGQLVDMIVSAIQAGGVATAELGKKVGEAFQVAAKEINGAKAKAAADVAATNAEIAKLKERLAELEGSAPKSAGYRASLAPESIVKGKAAIAAAAPMTDIERAARVFAGEL